MYNITKRQIFKIFEKSRVAKLTCPSPPGIKFKRKRHIFTSVHVYGSIYVVQLANGIRIFG